jgi:hypothetical protein
MFLRNVIYEYNAEERIFHCHRCDNLKFHILLCNVDHFFNEQMTTRGNLDHGVLRGIWNAL